MIENPNFSREEEQADIVDATGVIIFDGDKVLVVTHEEGTILGKGIIGIPGGRNSEIDFNTGEPETDLHTAVRELEEETGLVTIPESLVEFEGNVFKKIMGINGNSRLMRWKLFICTAYSGNVHQELKDDVVASWMNIEELIASENLAPNVTEALFNARRFLSEQDK